jgi:hypothetical protein
MVRKRMSQELG